ncbi:MAG TPA: NAD-dependent epimerase/dehydratase family protein [Alphaproteobacteria bacterium]|nr:NAD-dependent epimerase/dehydratase family protein [Alphaproteobacteria bacterium]
MAKRKVLMTGATGYIASQMLPRFREIYELRLLDVKDTDPRGAKVPETIIADLSEPDLNRYREHFRGVDTVVHLGFHRGRSRSAGAYTTNTYEDERVNVDMAYNVYKVSHEEGIRRVVVASSNHAADWWEPLIHAGRVDGVTPETYPLSDNFYGWAKATYEHLGFLFACGRFGRKLETVQIRIGAPRELKLADYGNDRQRYKRDLGAYISPRDLTQLFEKSIECPQIDNEWGIPFQIFYGISNNARKFWGIANARRVIGYEPQDDSEVKYWRDIATFLMQEG